MNNTAALIIGGLSILVIVIAVGVCGYAIRNSLRKAQVTFDNILNGKENTKS